MVELKTSQGVVSIECEERLRKMAEIMLSMAEAMDLRREAFHDGMVILHGWSVYKFRGKPGNWRIEEPDFSTDPYVNSRPDCTFTLTYLAHQFAVAERLGLKPSQLESVSCFDVVLHPSCLRDQRIRAERIEPRGQKYSGWQVSSLDRKTSETDDMVTDVASLTKIRPALLKAILLPVGYAVTIDGVNITSVTDPSKRVVYQA